MIKSGSGQTLARIWHNFLIFAAPAFWQPQAWRGVLCILAGHRRVAGGGRQGSGSAKAAPAVGTPLLYVSRAWSPHRPDLGECVAGPGFEPGKTVIGDLQTLPDTALTCANIREIRHFGTHLT
jgi:hypothetical protein